MSGLIRPTPCMVRPDLEPLLTPWFSTLVHGSPERSGVYQTRDAEFNWMNKFYNYYDADHGAWYYGHKEPGKALQIGKSDPGRLRLPIERVAAWRGLTMDVTGNFEKEITA